MLIHASLDAMDFSQYLANLRHRPNQAKVRSTTQRRGKTSKPSALSERLMISIVQSPRCFKVPRRFRPAIGAVGEDVMQPGAGLADGLGHRRRPVAVLDLGAMDDQAKQQADGIDEDVALAALDAFARIQARYSDAFKCRQGVHLGDQVVQWLTGPGDLVRIIQALSPGS